ncbi:MAG: phosphohistidine phosphatase [Gammaproteobacteria bacterium SG8_47]|nr:MAG: phosphohistidine phosphatase [Gammaproteobacteria bacterium SG8_47]
MSRELLILRHAKSDWGTGAASDFARPLSERGRKDAPRLGKWMRKHHLKPEHVVSSPAVRATETATAVSRALEFRVKDITFDERIYLAGLTTLLEVIASCPTEASRVMLVGHNPGLDELVEYLVQGELPLSDAGKLMTTCALARIELSDNWATLPRGSGKLLSLTRPRELP